MAVSKWIKCSCNRRKWRSKKRMPTNFAQTGNSISDRSHESNCQYVKCIDKTLDVKMPIIKSTETIKCTKKTANSLAEFMNRIKLSKVNRKLYDTTSSLTPFHCAWLSTKREIIFMARSWRIDANIKVNFFKLSVQRVVIHPLTSLCEHIKRSHIENAQLRNFHVSRIFRRNLLRPFVSLYCLDVAF